MPSRELETCTMMFAYDFDRLSTFLFDLLGGYTSGDARRWLENEGKSIRANGDVAKFNAAFVLMPRKTGKAPIALSEEQQRELDELRNGFTVDGWTSDRLARVWLLMQVNPEEKENYISRIENLFLSAEMSELVALYSALPVLAFPDAWRKRCAEGIRSNIGQVLEAVICRNPYPSEQLDEAAWNQLVLKAIFTEKPVLDIIGLRQRMNKNLARSLTDYAHERWAAHRDVNPLLWAPFGPYINGDNVQDIRRLLLSADVMEREAAALACSESTYEPARRLLDENRDLKKNIDNGSINWRSIASRVGTVSQ